MDPFEDWRNICWALFYTQHMNTFWIKLIKKLLKIEYRLCNIRGGRWEKGKQLVLRKNQQKAKQYVQFLMTKSALMKRSHHQSYFMTVRHSIES